jgi:hypothetical protein
MTDQLNHINEIKKRLRSVRQKEYLKNAVTGFNIVLVLFFTLNVTVTLIELFGARSIESRTVLFYLLVLITSVSLLVLLIHPLMKYFGLTTKYNYMDLAQRVGSRFPNIKDNLLNSIQLIENKNKYGYSSSLVQAAFKAVYEKTRSIDFTSIISLSSTKKYFQSTAGVIIFSVIIFLLFPAMRTSSYRILNFNKEFIEPPEFTFQVDPGDVKLTKGDDLTIKVHAIGDAPESIFIATQTVEQTDYETREIKRDSLGNFTYRINAVKSSFEYFASKDDVVSEIYSADVISRPLVSSFEIVIRPPAYSGLPETVQKDNGNISTLPGSNVSINFESNKELSDAYLMFNDSSKVYFNTQENLGSASFTVLKNDKYSIRIKDVENYYNSDPITYSINTLVDEYPNITMIAPNEDVTLGQANQLPLTMDISDDYGFNKLVLNYRISASAFEQPWSEYKRKEITITKLSEQEVFYLWNFNEIVLAVNDVLSYYLEVFDNDNINGPKSSKTPLFNIRIPSLDELFSEAEDTQQEAEQDLTKLLEETKELTDEMQRISNEMKQDNRELTYEEKEKIDQAMKNFEELANKTEEVQKSINEMQQQMQENDLLSEETLKKYMELQELMDELGNEEMRQAMERMQQMMEQMNRNQAQQAFEDMKFNEEMFQKSLERTLNLLKRIQIEQKVDELVKRTEDIVEQMEDMINETQNSEMDENTSEEMSQKQEQVSDKLEKLQEEMNKLNEKMKEFDDMPQQDMEQLNEQMKQQQNSELSKQIEQQIQQMQQMQAMQNQQQLSQNMQQMQQQMKKMQQNMQQQTQLQTMFEMMKAVNDLLTLSKEQESLKQSTSKTPPTSDKFSDNAKTQSDLQRNLDRLLQQLNNLSQKSFAITPEMGKALGEARNQMNQALSSMQNRVTGATIQRQASAMRYLNEAASLMKGNMEQMMQGGQSGGMMSLMQQMQQMSQQQMQLNQLTQQLNQQGQLSPQQQAQLQRLAQQQEMIRKSLQELNNEAKESGQSRKLAANLEKVLEEMQEVVTGMRTEKLDDNLVQSQERILSKLLDAQRSINERDFEKQRESEVGKAFDRESPPEIIFATEEGRDQLRDELLKAIREGYKKDYEDLIRKYYEALQKQTIKN